MADTFLADIENFEKRTVQNMIYIAVNSVQDVVEGAQTPQRGVTKGGTFEEGKIPVAEAELINSLTTDGTKGAESYVFALAGYQIGDSMQFAWTAPHAMPMEVGTKHTRGRHFVGLNAKRFVEFVQKYAGEFT